VDGIVVISITEEPATTKNRRQARRNCHGKYRQSEKSGNRTRAQHGVRLVTSDPTDQSTEPADDHSVKLVRQGVGRQWSPGSRPLRTNSAAISRSLTLAS